MHKGCRSGTPHRLRAAPLHRSPNPPTVPCDHSSPVRAASGRPNTARAARMSCARIARRVATRRDFPRLSVAASGAALSGWLESAMYDVNSTHPHEGTWRRSIPYTTPSAATASCGRRMALDRAVEPLPPARATNRGDAHLVLADREAVVLRRQRRDVLGPDIVGIARQTLSHSSSVAFFLGATANRVGSSRKALVSRSPSSSVTSPSTPAEAYARN